MQIVLRKRKDKCEANDFWWLQLESKRYLICSFSLLQTKKRTKKRNRNKRNVFEERGAGTRERKETKDGTIAGWREEAGIFGGTKTENKAVAQRWWSRRSFSFSEGSLMAERLFPFVWLAVFRHYAAGRNLFSQEKKEENG